MTVAAWVRTQMLPDDGGRLGMQNTLLLRGEHNLLHLLQRRLDVIEFLAREAERGRGRTYAEAVLDLRVVHRLLVVSRTPQCKDVHQVRHGACARHAHRRCGVSGGTSEIPPP